MRVQGRAVGSGNPVFLIAEAGVNHNGSPEEAHRLIDAAATCGVDSVKFQTFTAAELVGKGATKAPYQIETTGAGQSQYEMLRGLELPRNVWPELKSHAEEKGLVFLSTPYGVDDVALLDDLDVAAFKLASIHAAEPPFLAFVSALKRPLFLSTGMADMGEIDRAVASIRGAGNDALALLQCTSEYPAPIHAANLRVIPELRRRFNTVVGYSDHTTGTEAALAAVALGAAIVERHFTLDCQARGPDHRASLEPEALAALVRKIRSVEAALGSNEKVPTAQECVNRTAMRREFVANEDIAAGAVIRFDMLSLRRPSRGQPVHDVIGARAAAPIAQGETVQGDRLIRG